MYTVELSFDGMRSSGMKFMTESNLFGTRWPVTITVATNASIKIKLKGLFNYRTIRFRGGNIINGKSFKGIVCRDDFGGSIKIYWSSTGGSISSAPPYRITSFL